MAEADDTPKDYEAAIVALAEMAADVNGSIRAFDLLLRGLYTERAVRLGTQPEEAEEEILSLASSLQDAPRRGHDGEELILERAEETLRSFATSLRYRLDALLQE